MRPPRLPARARHGRASRPRRGCRPRGARPAAMLGRPEVGALPAARLRRPPQPRRLRPPRRLEELGLLRRRLAPQPRRHARRLARHAPRAARPCRADRLRLPPPSIERQGRLWVVVVVFFFFFGRRRRPASSDSRASTEAAEGHQSSCDWLSRHAQRVFNRCVFCESPSRHGSRFQTATQWRHAHRTAQAPVSGPPTTQRRSHGRPTKTGPARRIPTRTRALRAKTTPTTSPKTSPVTG
mmetsp:Transcript_25568/g.101943  ORF Transcript_25568/g.101943 Transcript_25568/m.101943 type:complete len:239 (-) Transcript_25568:110-826(-)